MDKSVYVKRWFLYIGECGDGTFYVGISRDVGRRINEHNRTNKCRYTRFRKPVILRYKEPCKDYSAARKREAEVKRYSRAKKLNLMKNR